MNNIDRLIIKAKKECGCEQLIAAFISSTPGMPEEWIASASIWNGQKRSGTRREEQQFLTVDEALKWLDELGKRYPSARDVVILIDDVEE